MTGQKTLLSTIGYEGASLEDFVATLIAANIRRLLDIRELPISRRKGFAKTALSKALDRVGIEYIHLRGLGDPKAGREAARKNEIPKFKAIFSRHLKSELAQIDLKTAAGFAVEGGACLMCFERDFHACHRTLVATAVCDSVPIAIRHLGVRHGLAQATNRTIGPRENSSSRKGSAARRQAPR